MIAIPNMKKPGSCWGCFCENDAICQALALLKADSSLGEVAFHEVRPDCPLVEIVTCGECKYSGESLFYPFEMACKYHLGHTYYTEADRFCYFGERRSDETN